MKVRFTEAALADINEIREFLLSNYRPVASEVEQRIRIIVPKASRMA